MALADVYRRLGAPMLGKHAHNHGSNNYHVQPAIEEMIVYMKRGQFTIASRMGELAEVVLQYRDEDYKIVRLRDDLISAFRYAFMMRRSGKLLDECETYGRAPWAMVGSQFDLRRPRHER